jgi:peptide/nickel transport system substrate-binding protein
MSDAPRPLPPPPSLGDFQWSWTIATDALTLGRALDELLSGGEAEAVRSGAGFLARLHPADLDRHRSLIRAHLVHHAPLECASRLRCADGSWRWVFLTGGAIDRTRARTDTVVGVIYPLSRAEGAARGDNPFSALFANVWHAGIAALEESEVERARRISAEAESFSQREFLATISHEIRNPLSVIFANIGLLRARAEREADDSLLERLSALERAGKHLRDIVSDVLDLAKADAGKVETELGWFELEPLLLEVEDMGISLTQGEEVLFLLDAPADPGRMYSDRLKLKQILLNLVGNAAKFTRSGRITLRVTDDPEGLLFAVEDTGVGIPADKLDVLFKAFSQVGGAHSPRSGGTGLGLYISERYTRMLGGRMSVSGREGEGTVFDFVLPRVVAPPSAHIPRVRDEQRLVIGHTEDLTSLDPHLQIRNTNQMIAWHHFDTLTRVDATGALRPGLAERWEALEPGGWRLHLRQGVRFHDGSPFDAADVLATFARLRDLGEARAPYGAFLRPVIAIDAPSPHVLELRTRTPQPLLPIDLAFIAIINRDARDAGSDAFDQLRATNGTGPYRLTARPDERSLVFTAFDGHWRGAPDWREAEFRLIDENGLASITALLAGEVDLIDNVTPDQLVELQARDDVSLSSRGTNRVWYLFFDQISDASAWITDHQGVTLPSNPLKDARVRRAISMAIDRVFITGQIMAGQAQPVGDVAGPGVFGANPALRPHPYDPPAAKALLEQAGYPDGFRITLHGSRDRSFNGPTTLRAIALMLNAIGIICRPEAVAGRDYYTRAARGEFAFGLSGWGSVTGETSYSLRMLLATRDPDRGLGAVNRGGYSNPEFDALVVQALTEMDDATREALLRHASALAINDVAIAPICYRNATWATKRGLGYHARADGMTMAMETFRV